MARNNSPSIKDSLVFPGVIISKRNIGHKQIEQLSTGLTKREYFAGLAMQGLISDVETLRMALRLEELGGGTLVTQIAKSARLHADALIKELNKNEPTD